MLPVLPEFWVPVENDDYLPLLATLDGVELTGATYEVAIQEQGEARPLAVWTTNPGPKTPQVRGTYYVFARALGSPRPAVCVGKLIVF